MRARVEPPLILTSLICIYLPGVRVNLEIQSEARQKAQIITAPAPREGTANRPASRFKDPPPHELSIHSYLGPLVKMHPRSMLLHVIITTSVKNKRWRLSGPASSNSMAVMNKPARVLFLRLHSTQRLLVANRRGLHSSQSCWVKTSCGPLTSIHNPCL